MNQTFHIVYNSDLYEIVIAGTLICSIKKHSAQSNLAKEMEFDELPTKVKNELIETIVKQMKG